MAVGVAALVFAAGPAMARDEGATTADPAAATAALPMTLIVSLEDQELRAYRGLELVGTSRVSSGMPGYDTPTGIYSILQKRKWHRSNIYSNAPMPFMQRITWSGMALHAGVVPDRPASHGCIRLPEDFARDLFAKSDLGAHVVVTKTMPSPQSIEHPFLFQSAPPAPRLASAGADSVGALDRAAAALAVAGGAADSAAAASAEAQPALYREELDLEINEPAAAAPEGAAPAIVKAMPTALNMGSADASVPPSAQSDTGSASPLRILIARRTGRERVKDVQRLLAELGHDPGEIDGYMGSATGTAIRSFQQANGMARTGMLTEELIDAVFKAAGRAQPTGHLYVRQDQKDLFDAPARIRDPELPLGTQIYTAMDIDEHSGRVDWVAVGAEMVESATPAGVLDRIEIGEDMRARIQAMLTPGSSLIVSDSGLGRETGKGTDFIVQFD